MRLGADVRALARNPDSVGLPDDVRVVRGDLLEPDTLDAALGGVGLVFLVWPFFTAEGGACGLAAAHWQAPTVSAETLLKLPKGTP